MSRIETEHNGHAITYAENEDVWRCWSMNVEGKTLSAVKAKLNKLDADARRVNVPVIVLNHYGCTVDAIGLATLIDKGDVWIAAKDRRGSTQRSKTSMSRIVLDTPENREAIKAASAKEKQAESVMKEAEGMVYAIPRVTADDLKSLTIKEPA